MTSQDSDDSLLRSLERYDSCTLSNAIEKFAVRPRDSGYLPGSIRCIFPETPVMVGRAVTATIRARGNVARSDDEPLWRHVTSVPGPRVLVAQDLDDPPGCGALLGEVMCSILMALGCVGTVTNGCVRDLNEVRQLGFHYFAESVCVSHGYVRWEKLGIPVTFGTTTINPGDLIHADRHGVLVIPGEIAEQLPAAADEIVEAEQTLIRWVRSSAFTLDGMIERRRVRH